jgi:hypothetical protein
MLFREPARFPGPAGPLRPPAAAPAPAGRITGSLTPSRRWTSLSLRAGPGGGPLQVPHQSQAPSLWSEYEVPHQRAKAWADHDAAPH